VRRPSGPNGTDRRSTRVRRRGDGTTRKAVRSHDADDKAHDRSNSNQSHPPAYPENLEQTPYLKQGTQAHGRFPCGCSSNPCSGRPLNGRAPRSNLAGETEQYSEHFVVIASETRLGKCGQRAKVRSGSSEGHASRRESHRVIAVAAKPQLADSIATRRLRRGRWATRNFDMRHAPGVAHWLRRWYGGKEVSPDEELRRESDEGGLLSTRCLGTMKAADLRVQVRPKAASPCPSSK